jgi:aryl-alcohol dehydrogenase-like predicted oxidoreductase
VLAAVGTTSAAHLDDAFAAAELELSPEQLAWLER